MPPHDRANHLPLYRRPSRSLDLDSPSKAAAWIWHLHGTQPIDIVPDHDHRFVLPLRSRSHRSTDSRFKVEAMQDFSRKAASFPVDQAEVWDCGSVLYDKFELASISDRLERGIRAAEAANYARRPHSGLFRSFSSSRKISTNGSSNTIHNSKPVRPSNDVAGGSTNKHSKRRWSMIGELVKSLKAAAMNLPNRIRVKRRARKDAEEEPKHYRYHRHFHHHHHHHHLHQFNRSVHVMDCDQNNDGDNKHDISHQRRTESARFGSDTLSKICLDQTWS